MPTTPPIAIILPHAGMDVPPELDGRLALDERHLFNEADIYTDLLFDFRGNVAHWLRFPYARALIDVNRPDDPALTRPGDGIVKQRTSYGVGVYRNGRAPDPALERELKARYWRPWHQQLAAIAADRRIKLVLDCHSMAAVGPRAYDDPGAVRPRAVVCNLGDPLGEPEPKRKRISAPPALTRTFANLLGGHLGDLPALTPTGPNVLLNQPYWGGWDVWATTHRRQPWFMIEINRALHLGDQEGDSPVRPPDPDHIDSLRLRIWESVSALCEYLPFCET